MNNGFSTLGKVLSVLISIACIIFLVYMNLNDRVREQQAAEEVAAVNEDTRETEKEIAQAEAEEKAAALEEKRESDSFYQKLKDGFDVKILVVGDTIANGYGASSADATWFNLVKKSIEEQYNVGVTMDNVSILDSGAYASYARVKMEEDEDYDLTLICTGANDSEETLPVYYEALLRAIRDTFTRCSAISIQEYMESENNAKNMTIQSLSTAYNALSADVYSQMVADPTPYMQDGGYLNDAGHQLYADTVMSVIKKGVEDGMEYAVTQTAPIYTETLKFDRFLYVPADMFTRTGRQYVIETSLTGIVAIDFDVYPGDNSFDFYLDRVKTASLVLTNAIATPVEHIELIEGEVKANRRVGVIFATEEVADGFRGMCVTTTE